eukprot:2943278-Rhodomonas_salina.1
MSWMELRRLSFLAALCCRTKNFCACDATCPRPRTRHSHPHATPRTPEHTRSPTSPESGGVC